MLSTLNMCPACVSVCLRVSVCMHGRICTRLHANHLVCAVANLVSNNSIPADTLALLLTSSFNRVSSYHGFTNCSNSSVH